MSKELYILEKIKAQSSDNSNLCWAACLEMIHKITNNSSPINFQSVAVQSYKTSVCYSDLGLNYQSNNIVIKESCLALVFKDYGLKITKKHDYIKDFNFYFNHLNNTGLPLLLGINTGQGIVTYGHLVLVCGYGYCGENKYLLTFFFFLEILQKFWIFEDSTFLYRNNESIRL
ncbi:MAG: hypothetical protein AB8B78_09370 [Polaribacter sp.]